MIFQTNDKHCVGQTGRTRLVRFLDSPARPTPFRSPTLSCSACCDIIKAVWENQGRTVRGVIMKTTEHKSQADIDAERDALEVVRLGKIDQHLDIPEDHVVKVLVYMRACIKAWMKEHLEYTT